MTWSRCAEAILQIVLSYSAVREGLVVSRCSCDDLFNDETRYASSRVLRGSFAAAVQPHIIIGKKVDNLAHISLCTCEKVAENGCPGGCFRHLLDQSPTHTSGRFNHFLGFSASNADHSSRFRHPLSLTLLSPPFLRGTYFGSTGSVPKIDLSSSTLRIIACGI